MAEPPDDVHQLARADTPHGEIALRRRELSALITEELRRLDVDDIFAASMSTLVDRCERRDAEKARR